jgi:peptidoglycan hydrolase CwlO-like protein
MKKTIVSVLLIALLIAGAYLSFTYLFSGSNTPATAVVVDNPARLLEALKAKEQAYNSKIDSIDAVNYTLSVKVNKAQAALSQVKQENKSLKQTIDDLLTIHYTTTDTAQMLDNCDSLAITLQDLVTLNITKDSIYENLTADLQTQVSLKDSVIEWQQQQYDSLRGSYHKTVAQQQELLQENTALHKTVKKQKKGKGFLGVILVAVGSLFVFHSIK